MGNFNYSMRPSTDSVYDDGTIENSPIISFIYGAASMQGWRRKQEDKFLCMANFCKGYSFFGLYDGHGGSEISEFLKDNLHLDIQHFLESENDVELALYLGFLSCDLSLKDTETIAELNSMLEEENIGEEREKQFFMYENPRYFEELKQKENDSVSNKLKDLEKAEDTAGPSREILVAKRTKNHKSALISVVEQLSQEKNLADSSQESNVAGPSQESNVAGPSQESNVAGPNQETNVAGPSQETNVAGPSQESNVAGPSQERNSPSDDEEMEDIEKPTQYLLNDELESSDPEDEDFDVEDEETSSEESDEETTFEPSKLKLTAEEFNKLEPGDLSGSTGTVAILNKSRIYVANVGDSRCVLSRKGKAIDMSVDHTPSDSEEHDRITGNGGIISDGRVNDTLNMTRAFGDFKLKGSSLVPAEQCVTAEPFIKSIPIERDDEFLVIASDGLWNSMSSQEIVDYINMRLKIPETDIRDICDELFKLILAPDTDNDGTGCDNMTCIIVKFIQRQVRQPTSSSILLTPRKNTHLEPGSGIYLHKIDY